MRSEILFRSTMTHWVHQGLENGDKSYGQTTGSEKLRVHSTSTIPGSETLSGRPTEQKRYQTIEVTLL